MKARLELRNQQRTRRVDRAYLFRIIRSILKDDLQRTQYALGIYVVGTDAITRINETHLRHAGSTDVITFDYSEPGSEFLAGEVFVCIDEAVRQAPKFQETWQSELVRYVLHGLLHLCGYDDSRVQARKQMKREETRIMRRLQGRFALRRVGTAARSALENTARKR